MMSLAPDAVCAAASVLNGELETPVPAAPSFFTYQTFLVTTMLTLELACAPFEATVKGNVAVPVKPTAGTYDQPPAALNVIVPAALVTLGVTTVSVPPGALSFARTEDA